MTRPVFTAAAGLAAVALFALPPALSAQQHQHAPAASGIPHGIPRFCESPTIVSVRSGAWSSPATWSTGRAPAAADAVAVRSGTEVTYDVVSDAALSCLDIEGSLQFRPDVATRLKVGTLMVLPGGSLQIGTEASPVSADVTAELIFANRPLDTAHDPEQFGNGLIGLGKVVMHGAVKAPTFIRLTQEPTAGLAALKVEQPASGWRGGDHLVLPDTRQLLQNERGVNYRPQSEVLTLASISGDTLSLERPLAFTHRGARDGAGALDFLPHVGNVTRNVVLRSENASGTRGHVIFVGRPDVDIRYTLFKNLGRTRMGVLDSADYEANGTVRHVGTNQIGRYSIHFHHAFGPTTPQANGYQFTLIGNAVDDASKWAITIHNSHYGLIRDNVVYQSRGAGIVTEDGSESYNLIEHNFSMRSEGSGEFAPRSGYGGVGNDPGGEGAGFWFRGPNNIVRNNVAANVDVFGYGIAAGALGIVRVPKAKGANPSQEGGYTLMDTTDTPLLEFTGNEAYGALQTGVAVGWNGVLDRARVWHASRYAITAFLADRLTIDGFVGRGDSAVLGERFETPTGIWFGNYAAKTLTVRGANIQGMRVGVASPFFSRTDIEPGRGDGVARIEGSYFRNYVGVAVATAYADGDLSVKHAEVRGSRFEPLERAGEGQYPRAAISMNYGMAAGDTRPRAPLLVYDFNGVPGDTFRVFYSFDVPAIACGATRTGLDGATCSGDGRTSNGR